MKYHLSCLVVVSALAMGLPAMGQEAATQARPPLAQSLEGPAKEAYDAAKVLLNNHDSAGAFSKFQQAYEISKDPRLLFNMAICARDMRTYARMQKLLLRYRQEAGAELSNESKGEVDAALSAIRDLIGTVNIVVKEPGALVVVDGETVGKGPLTMPLLLDLGKHTLSVTKAGFDGVERTIECVGGNEATVDVALVAQAQTAHLAVIGGPGATVMIDKESVGKERYDGTLPSGTHEIKVTAPGKAPHEVLVDLRNGETRTVHVTLVAESRASTWPWIAGGAVAVVGLTVGGYFLFRPREERGPAPHGSLDTVSLTIRSSLP